MMPKGGLVCQSKGAIQLTPMNRFTIDICSRPIGQELVKVPPQPPMPIIQWLQFGEVVPKHADRILKLRNI